MNRPRERSPLRPTVRIVVLVAGGALAFALAATFGRPTQPDAEFAASVVAPAERVRPSAIRSLTSSVEGAAPERLSAQALHNPFGALAIKDFAAQAASAAKPASTPVAAKPSKAASAPPVTVEPPPPPPAAPPLPFVAVGSIAGADVTGGQPVAFIRQQDNLLLVRAGESIGTLYRVESISAEKIEFTYLPLMQRQALALAP
ncbi:MAG: hypothetical protein JWQ07_114 [Ramlibacter sp.]|nr:hypothetical protein [Ramlibacter sp.]